MPNKDYVVLCYVMLCYVMFLVMSFDKYRKRGSKKWGSFNFSVTFILSSPNALHLDLSKTLSFGKKLNK